MLFFQNVKDINFKTQQARHLFLNQFENYYVLKIFKLKMKITKCDFYVQFEEFQTIIIFKLYKIEMYSSLHLKIQVVNILEMKYKITQGDFEPIMEKQCFSLWGNVAKCHISVHRKKRLYLKKYFFRLHQSFGP